MMKELTLPPHRMPQAEIQAGSKTAKEYHSLNLPESFSSQKLA